MYECVHPYQALAYPLDLRMLHRISANHAAKALEVHTAALLSTPNANATWTVSVCRDTAALH